MSHQKFHMRKILLSLSFLGLLMSCQKVQEGSNKSVLRMNNVSHEGFPYSADAQGEREKQLAKPVTEAAPAITVKMDSTATTEVQGAKISTEQPASGQADMK